MSEPCPPEGRIDLRPLLSHPDATEMLLLARGQLNRAFRQHGLCPPDPMRDGRRSGSDLDATELDDPAAQGVERAQAKFREPFVTWAAGMPLDLAGPVLTILRQTHAALSQQPGGGDAARVAVLIAHDFLLDHVNGD